MINAEFGKAEASERKFRSWSAVYAIPMVMGMIVLIAMSSTSPRSQTSHLFSRHLTFKEDETDTPQEQPTRSPTYNPTELKGAGPTPYKPTERPTAGSEESVCEPESYDIELDITRVPTQYQDAFTAAVARWESVIVGDIKDVVRTFTSRYCGELNNREIDDLLICGSVEPIDGEGRVLGSAGPERYRIPGNFPWIGGMRLDEADMDFMVTQGIYEDVIVSYICESQRTHRLNFSL
jgi:hypothetical protein